jgi:lipopolysaccharide/colanic/teichoic acid biosynthesis glycosyltransferase
MHYIRNWTIWLDIFVLLNTIPAVLRKRGAY